MNRNDTLSRNQKRALAALVTEPGVTQAARACGLAKSTLYRYLRDPTFKAELARIHDALLTSATSALAGKAEAAVEALGQTLDDPDVSASVKARVALGILHRLYDLVGVRAVLERIAKLEEEMQK